MAKIKGLMPSEIIMPDEMTEFYPDTKYKVDFEADQMARTFIDPTRTEPDDPQWRDKYQKKILEIFYQCYLKNEAPPISVIMLTGFLFGKRHMWPTEKYAVLNAIAHNYPPLDESEKPPTGLISFAEEELLKHRKGENHQKTIKSWMNDPIFRCLWKIVRKQIDSRDTKFQEWAMEAIERMNKESDDKKKKE